MLHKVTQRNREIFTLADISDTVWFSRSNDPSYLQR